MKGKSIQSICITLLLVLGATATQAGAAVFTVGSNGEGNYSSIQEAISAAQNGDTILVSPGAYRENVNVSKELSIIASTELSGDMTNRTYVIGATPNDDVFSINSSNVTIRGFHILGGHSGMGMYGESGVYLEGVQNCSLLNNTMVLNYEGISLNNSRSNFLYNNFIGLGSIGILLTGSNENRLLNNEIVANNEGILLDNSTNNTFMNNSVDMNGLGIYLNTSSGNSIYLNKFFSNFQNALDEGKNTWNTSSAGNLWSDYNGTDVDGNGIGDTPYIVNQTTGSIDYMPLVTNISSGETQGNMSGNNTGMS
jgi:nitrous oxidase accessory protein